MAKKDNEEIPFSASPSAGNSEKLKALQAAMDKICPFLHLLTGSVLTINAQGSLLYNSTRIWLDNLS